jgi:hypothetical protein
MRNRQTTFWGLVGVAGATLVFLADWALNGAPDYEKLGLVGAALIYAAGLNRAADARTVTKLDEKVENHLDKL